MTLGRLNQRGQTLIEIAIGMTILSVVLLTATSAAISSSQQGSNAYIDLMGSELVQEGIEQVTLYRNYCASQGYVPANCTSIRNWATTDATSTLSTPQFDVSSWKLIPATLPIAANLGAEDPFTPGKFSRYFQFKDVSDPTLTGFVEIEAKVTISWSDNSGNTQTVSGATVLTNWNGG
jgi:prepilin-type N-terminal cleavage/methylation domain-containing protein